MTIDLTANEPEGSSPVSGNPVVLTPERALELMREVVAEYGEDHVYELPEDFPVRDGVECYYVHGDKPGCIAGHVYHRAGVTLDQLRDREGNGADASYFTNPSYGLGLSVPDLTADILRQAQMTQDNGQSWGAALAEAEEMYADLTRAQ